MRIFSDILLSLGYLPSSRRYEQQRRRMDDLYVHFHGIAAREVFQRYLVLDTYINSPNYEADIAEIKSLGYKDSPERLQLQRYGELKKYKEIKDYIKKGEESDSKLLKEFIDLHNMVRSSAFKQRVVYLKNKQKYKESDAYKQFLEYRQLKKSSIIKKYFSLQKKYETVFNELDSWKLLFADEFEGTQLNKQWSTQPVAGMDLLQKNYVQNTEYGIVDPGNVSLSGNMLKLAIKHTDQKGMAWDKALGFVPRDFNYSTAAVNTANRFQLLYGKIEAKVRVPNVKNIYHAFWLTANTPTPAISLFNFCNNYLETGIYQANGNDQSRRRLHLNPHEFYIVEVEWNEKNIIWTINGKVINQKANTVNTPLFFQLTSGIVGKISAQQLPQHFDIDWIRVHAKIS